MTRRHRILAALLLASATMVAVAPAVVVGASAAAFTDSQELTANVVTAGTCSSTAWSSLVTSTATIPTSSRDVYHRLAGTASIGNDSWSGGSWTATSMVLNQPGALYCDSSTAVATDATTDRATTASQSQSTYFTGNSSSTSTVMFWTRTTTDVAGRLASVGNATYSDRVIWVNASGLASFSARGGAAGTSWTISGGSAINDGSWHLIVVTMGSTSTGSSGGGAKLYVDGVNVASQAAGSGFAFRTGSSTTTGFGSSSNVAWSLGAQPAATTPTGAPTAGASPSGYDEFVQFDTTNLSATLLGNGVGSLYRAGES